MVKLPNIRFRQMVPLLREKGFYEPEKLRKIFWSAYSLTQIEEASTVLEFINKEVKKTGYLELKGKRGRPLTDPKNLAKAILIAETLGLPERQSQGWSKIIGPYVKIKEIDDRVIGEAYNNIEVTHILRQVFNNNKSSDGILSGDGTGLEKSRKENYESTKNYASYMISIVDSREVVQAFKLGERAECKVMKELINEVDGESLRLDAGFNDRELVEMIAQKEMIPYIFPKSNNKLNGSFAWRKMYLELFYDVMTWLTKYHQRSHSESFHSSFKRKNRLLMKQRPLAQLTQILARIILHNRRKIDYFTKLAKTN